MNRRCPALSRAGGDRREGTAGPLGRAKPPEGCAQCGLDRGSRLLAAPALFRAFLPLLFMFEC